MSTDADHADLDDDRIKWSPWAIAAAALLVVLFGLIAVAGFRGCLFVDPREAAKTEEEKKKEEAEKKKEPDFEIASPKLQPAEPETPFQYVKPGHWATATQRMKANYRDFVGRSLGEIVTKDREPHAIPHTPFVVRASRPVALSKAAPKVIENTIFIPPASGTLYLDVSLEERGLGSAFRPGSTLLSRMPSYQYHFVVLAKELSRYGFIKSLDSVDVPYDGESELDDTEDALHYRVVLFDATQTLPLSDNPLTWSSIAYMLWDEVDPQLVRMTPEQQRALVDWVHWGGQLIISGPDSLDLLQGTFLEEYLPATNGGTRTITAKDLEAFNENWMISTSMVPGKPLVPTAPWSGIKLEPVKETGDSPEARPQAPPDSLWQSTGGLVAERRIGRGRIVVSAMQLSERDLINWRSGFESFFNAALLRRPARVYREGGFGDLTLTWADPKLASRRLDARLTSNLYYLARDLGVETAYQFVEVEDEFANQYNQYGLGATPQTIREYRPPADAGGLGSWNDFNATATAARDALREAAGVEVPGAGFVVVCLAAYLIALVPLNWLVFHTIGRVEWAWIAAPIIAVAGTFTVINRAQLDIGFVRAQTEIGLLELQPDHSRGHFTRYTAMYTSLSTTYDLEFDNLTTLAAPFPRGLDDPVYRKQRRAPVDFQRYDTVRLAGLPIASNSTGFVHSEQMLSLDGAIRLGRSTAANRPQIENRSKLELRSAAVVQKMADGAVRGMWIGDFAPGRSVPLALAMVPLEENETPFDKERAADARLHNTGRLNLEPMFRLALAPAHTDEGEMRLVARIDEILPGETISPAASQVRGATLVVAHLDYGELQKPEPDRNTRQDIKFKIENEQ